MGTLGSKKRCDWVRQYCAQGRPGRAECLQAALRDQRPLCNRVSSKPQHSQHPGTAAANQGSRGSCLMDSEPIRWLQSCTAKPSQRPQGLMLCTGSRAATAAAVWLQAAAQRSRAHLESDVQRSAGGGRARLARNAKHAAQGRAVGVAPCCPVPPLSSRVCRCGGGWASARHLFQTHLAWSCASPLTPGS